MPDASDWRKLRQSKNRLRIGELELRWIVPSPDGTSRVGVAVRKKNGSAPLRNRIRRQLRELVRTQRSTIGSAWILWSFAPKPVLSPTAMVRDQALLSLQQAGLLPP
ncbi:MAG: ribonuclease P protein component [Fibrobacteres bacterium]|nr:ribonuclease P protein component [Fibrobacterota bacterium]